MTQTAPLPQDDFDTSTFDDLESNVQSYARSFPVVFDRAEGTHVFDTEGRAYLDFLAGAGSLNYGHNHPVLRKCLIEYIERGGITHSLDMHTQAKEAFLASFDELILSPRGLSYVVQFTGPTGTNAVEAALKLARNVTGRHNVIAFTNGFHGVSLGAMAATGNSHHRGASGIPLSGVTHVPYDGYLDGGADSVALLEKLLDDSSSGVDEPAAVIVETVQGEGGLNVASEDWLRRLERACRKRDILLIVDDIQAGCGRTGSFFSFEASGITPDIVTLSKSLSGYGTPFAVTIFRESLDCWKPGEHNGTFRGNNHAFVTATAAIRHFWADAAFEHEIIDKGEHLAKGLRDIAAAAPSGAVTERGRGLMRGLEFANGRLATEVARRAFNEGLIIETSGADGQVVKCLPPLVIEKADIDRALAILRGAVTETFAARGDTAPVARVVGA